MDRSPLGIRGFLLSFGGAVGGIIYHFSIYLYKLDDSWGMPQAVACFQHAFVGKNVTLAKAAAAVI